ncbi:uncharacterized protein KIAA0895-like [Lingula anatina]|uniref:Uncharacterized protein KIAA0895-like n=1 Tax=Lingula anatina TaxID=7574 RepID=A0A1S3IE66_LINAN|nr:uncharacterized protein KIAA0895-like [Lingula anatina]|eukprot:XP_013396550.1 uncharacterized protein KIAA0895-like [Lingula anatina]
MVQVNATRRKISKDRICFAKNDHLKKTVLTPLNLAEQKERFLKYGITPQFDFRASVTELEKFTANKKGEIHFDLLPEAKKILEIVRMKYGDGGAFLEESFGPPIDAEEATVMLKEYIQENNVDGSLRILWSKTLPCSARLSWQGPNLKLNKPECIKYTMWVKDSTENTLLRKQGINCLADHEIGTHFLRMVNECLQPWFADRKHFGIRSHKSVELLKTEEGLANINTVFNAKIKYLWVSAFSYYTACMSVEMTFCELFEHLEGYIINPEMRWKHVMRVKRGLENPNALGGYGKDQCYFEGAVEILRNIENIDFHLLYCGKICLDELPRVKRLARMNCMKIPKFLQDVVKYKKILKHIAKINEIDAQWIPRPPTHSSNKSPERSHSSMEKGRHSRQSKQSTSSMSSKSRFPVIDCPKTSDLSSNIEVDATVPSCCSASCDNNKRFGYPQNSGQWECVKEAKISCTDLSSDDNQISSLHTGTCTLPNQSNRSKSTLLNRPRSRRNATSPNNNSAFDGKVVRNVCMFGSLGRIFDE